MNRSEDRLNELLLFIFLRVKFLKALQLNLKLIIGW
jgi:hypothetical protein